jgi:hypothetical protein
MKINATVTFTFALLFLMLGASLASSMAGAKGDHPTRFTSEQRESQNG